MHAVYKYTLPLTDADAVLRMPPGARLLSVQCQGGALCLWALVNTYAERSHERTFRVHGTGHPVPDVDRLEYVGTAMMHNGALVWHVFEVK